MDCIRYSNLNACIYHLGIDPTTSVGTLVYALVFNCLVLHHFISCLEISSRSIFKKIIGLEYTLWSVPLLRVSNHALYTLVVYSLYSYPAGSEKDSIGPNRPKR